MKRGVVLLIAVACALLLSAVFVPEAAAKKDPFLGYWWAIDPYDQSYQYMTIGGGPGSLYRVNYVDRGASLCGKGPSGEPLWAAHGTASYAASDTSGDGVLDTLGGTLPVFCIKAGHPFLGFFDAEFAYDPVTDTFVDTVEGTVWSH